VPRARRLPFSVLSLTLIVLGASGCGGSSRSHPIAHALFEGAVPVARAHAMAPSLLSAFPTRPGTRTCRIPIRDSQGATIQATCSTSVAKFGPTGSLRLVTFTESWPGHGPSGSHSPRHGWHVIVLPGGKAEKPQVFGDPLPRFSR